MRGATPPARDGSKKRRRTESPYTPSLSIQLPSWDAQALDKDTDSGRTAQDVAWFQRVRLWDANSVL